MKPTLLFIVALLFTTAVTAQYEINDLELLAGTHSDVSDPGGTSVPHITKRLGGVRYNHTNHNFIVNNGGGWLTLFNEGPYPDPYGRTGNNTDYFLYQGTNEISGNGGIIVFDTVRFNIGAGNIMHITNHRQGTLTPYGEVSGGIMVGRALYFNNGITTTNRQYPVESAIVFPNSAFYEGGLTDAQHVDGFVSEVNYPLGDDDVLGHGGEFIFPVGNGSEVYQLKRNGTFEDPVYLLTVGWVDGDPNTTVDPTQGIPNPTSNGYLDNTIKTIIPVGFWDWHYLDATEANPGGPGYKGAEALTNNQTITVSIPGLTLTGATAADLRLVGYDIQNFKWIPLGTTGATGLTKGSLLSGIIPANKVITAIAIGSIQNAILPVSFISFTAKAENCKALLKWETGMEQNNSHFVVERSTNGETFTAIGRVGAAGNSTSVQSYEFTDEAPASGINYYRIIQVDFDGKYSGTEMKPVRIQCNGNTAVKVYPNPAPSQVNIQSGKAIAQVNIVSAGGQTVMKYVPSQNQGTLSIHIQHIPNGIYLLQIINKDGTVDAIKLVKQ
ncbi:MAG: T9SS type A sorting domain-containing protein [Chitinophagaceae bacterium]|nr:T9SS type A sorting domain-containing protein [Chitinophagaceae bacterium]